MIARASGVGRIAECPQMRRRSIESHTDRYCIAIVSGIAAIVGGVAGDIGRIADECAKRVVRIGIVANLAADDLDRKSVV